MAFCLRFFYYYSSGLVAEWVTFSERAAHSVSRVFSLYFVYLFFLVISHFGFQSVIWILIASVPVHCLLLWGYTVFSRFALKHRL